MVRSGTRNDDHIALSEKAAYLIPPFFRLPGQGESKENNQGETHCFYPIGRHSHR